LHLLTLPPPPPIDRGRSALFLDLDGTLAEIATRPDDVVPEKARTSVLLSLNAKLGGAVAVLSGRSLHDVDRILEGAVGPVGAVHGLVRRLASGEVVKTLPSPRLPEVRAAFDDLIVVHPGLVAEDKGASVALHYRQRPQAEATVLEVTQQLAEVTGLVVQNGSMVSELRTAGPHKGDGLSAFMQEPPFLGRTPVMVGDDLTDEVAFAVAGELGGYGVLIGPARSTNARYNLASVEATLAWLAEA